MKQDKPEYVDTVDQNAAPRGMDSFLKLYLLAMVILVVAAGAYFLTQKDERVEALNLKLASADTLAEYPYRFRVLSLEEGVATVTSPRSADMGPMHFLRILDPSLRDKDVVHPDMMAAQDLLAQTQSEAARLLEEEPDVSRIRWQLDERWYAEQGVFLPD